MRPFFLQEYSRSIATYHFSAKELHALTCAHGLCRRVDVSEQHVCLAAHFARFHGGDVEYWAEGREEHVEGALEIWFLELLGQVLDVERLVGLDALFGGHGGGVGLCDGGGGHGWRRAYGREAVVACVAGSLVSTVLCSNGRIEALTLALAVQGSAFGLAGCWRRHCAKGEGHATCHQERSTGRLNTSPHLHTHSTDSRAISPPVICLYVT
jgi:hypothetical protein